MQFVAASIYSTLRPPRVYLASWDAVQLPLILALLLQRLFFNQWNVNWDRPENRTAFSRQKKWECLWAPQQEHTILQRLPEYYFLSIGREEEVKIKQHSMYS